MTYERGAALRQVEDLFRSTSPKLLREALLGSGGDRAAAEDLVQDAFQAMWCAWDRVGGLSADQQRAWLFGTLRHKIVDRFRWRRREFLIEPDQFTLLYEERSVPAEARRILAGEMLDRCWRVIEGMPPTQQHVFWLRAHEWKTAEIADCLGIKATTVRDHYRRGMQRLNDEVGNGKTVFGTLDGDDLEGGAAG
ncbi:RNA polymerase sigma-70 factor, ECF subfamily [Asanoa hainanensis]|uniref:RNA polymerase sigma-70 factor, ECF subfamily n=1 Tax=Asanoa hainanensis TaxID=560556 RepID=A0A239P7X8_9ACTN|nr:RNA polymerase sigma factor [Asanoa hainanensis]SNT63003.1 RNA polymerase sigma-70 factor, ECF subfamily [Asanoa hainanensis]